MKKIVFIITVFLSVIIIYSCKKDSTVAKSTAEESTIFAGDDVTLKLVMEGNAEQQEWMQSLKKDFYKEHPNIQIKDIWVSVRAGNWGNYITKIKTMIASGNSPDVVRIAVEGFELLHQEKLALPLNDYAKQHPEFVDNYEDLHPRIQKAAIIDGNLYGFAWDWNNVVAHINLDMLKAAGLSMPAENWGKEEFLQYAQALTREEDGQKVYGLFIPNYYFGLEAWLYNFGASFLNDAMTAATLNTPQALEAFTFLHDLVYKYEVSPVPVPGDNFLPMMVNRQVAMGFGGRWPVPSFVNAGLNFDIQYLPTFRQNQVIFGLGIFPVLVKSKHPEEAFVLSAWLSGTHSQKTYLNSFSIPSRMSVMDEVLPNNPPANSILYRLSADSARVVQSPARYPEVQQLIDRLLNEMMSDPTADIAGLLGAANDEVNRILAR